jgi:hypothetical protein
MHPPNTAVATGAVICLLPPTATALLGAPCWACAAVWQKRRTLCCIATAAGAVVVVVAGTINITYPWGTVLQA